MVAAETRERVAAQQASGSLPWIGIDDPSEPQRLQADHAVRLQEAANFQLGVPEKLTRSNSPLHVLQNNEGLADEKGFANLGTSVRANIRNCLGANRRNGILLW